MNRRLFFIIILLALASGAFISGMVYERASKNKLSKTDLAKAFMLLENDMDSLRRYSEPAPVTLYEDPANRAVFPLTTELPHNSIKEELEAQILNIRAIILRQIENKILDRISSHKLIYTPPVRIRSGQPVFWQIPYNIVPIAFTIGNPGPDTISKLRIELDGKKNPTSIDEIIAVATAGKSGDEEIALGLWSYVVKNRCHDWPSHPSNEGVDPVKLFSVYGYGFCSQAAKALAILANKVGFESRVRHAKGQHVVCEILVNGEWAMFDADGEVFYRTKEGKIASVDELCETPDLIFTQQSPVYSHAKLKEIYSNHHFVTTPLDKFANFTPHIILPKLRPGEELQFSIEKKGLFFVSRYLEVPREYANGLWRYKPVLNSSKNLPEGLTLTNVVLSEIGDKHTFLVSDPSKEATISCWFDLPFPVLRAQVKIDSSGDTAQTNNIQVAASRDGNAWINAHARAPEGKNPFFIFNNFPNRIGGAPDYRFLLKIVMPPQHDRKQFPKFCVELDLQMAPRSLPIPDSHGGTLDIAYESHNNQEIEVSFIHQGDTKERKNATFGESTSLNVVNVKD
jgi:hypothetical protein